MNQNQQPTPAPGSLWASRAAEFEDKRAAAILKLDALHAERRAVEDDWVNRGVVALWSARAAVDSQHKLIAHLTREVDSFNRLAELSAFKR